MNKKEEIHENNSCPSCSEGYHDIEAFVYTIWEDGVGYVYVRNENYCPACGKKLRE